eukprot:364003-Chlamydomonas_euryale.AAC.10
MMSCNMFGASSVVQDSGRPASRQCCTHHYRSTECTLHVSVGESVCARGHDDDDDVCTGRMCKSSLNALVHACWMHMAARCPLTQQQSKRLQAEGIGMLGDLSVLLLYMLLLAKHRLNSFAPPSGATLCCFYCCLG